MNIEPTQDCLLQAMCDLGFTKADIEANRRRNGELFLAPGVVIGIIRGDIGRKKFDVATG